MEREKLSELTKSKALEIVGEIFVLLEASFKQFEEIDGFSTYEFAINIFMSGLMTMISEFVNDSEQEKTIKFALFRHLEEYFEINRNNKNYLC